MPLIPSENADTCCRSERGVRTVITPPAAELTNGLTNPEPKSASTSTQARGVEGQQHERDDLREHPDARHQERLDPVEQAEGKHAAEDRAGAEAAEDEADEVRVAVVVDVDEERDRDE